MHSHFRVSWGYDTGMIQGRGTPGEAGQPRDTVHRRPERAALPANDPHLSSCGSLTVTPSSCVKAPVFRLSLF